MPIGLYSCSLPKYVYSTAHCFSAERFELHPDVHLGENLYEAEYNCTPLQEGCLALTDTWSCTLGAAQGISRFIGDLVKSLSVIGTQVGLP